MRQRLARRTRSREQNPSPRKDPFRHTAALSQSQPFQLYAVAADLCEVVLGNARASFRGTSSSNRTFKAAPELGGRHDSRESL